LGHAAEAEVTTEERPNVDQVMRGLKGFQRDTVEYVFDRLFVDPKSTHRFLVADEVGLGKTLVAKGVIAKAVDHLWDTEGRIDIIYICSNAEIARQNINRLQVNARHVALPSRLTLLPVYVQNLARNKVNFVPLTPKTSFDLKSSQGLSDERALLYWLLKEIWTLRGSRLQTFLQWPVQSRSAFAEKIKAYQRHPIDTALATSFSDALQRHIEAEERGGEPGIRTRYEELACSMRQPEPRDKQRAPRAKLIGELRGLLAASCLEALEPDLIILDEFQRFRTLLHGSDETANLARGLFEYTDGETRARVLLLSATPYKMFSLADEDEDNHYRDFLETLVFLTNDLVKTEAVTGTLKDYRRELFRLGAGGGEQLVELKGALEQTLRTVMVRTERLAVTQDRNGMLSERRSPPGLALAAGDLDAYLGLQELARILDEPDTIEYWKSAPYLLNFMESYQFKRSFERAVGDTQDEHLAAALAHRGLLLKWTDVSRYGRVDPANARLRALWSGTIEAGAWKLLWMPPSLPYYTPGRPYDDPGLQDFTKRLVFSSWVVVPKVIACLTSYEVERRIMRAFEPEARNTPPQRRRRAAGLLRFARADDRLTGMPVFGILFPSATLAEHLDPLALARDVSTGGAIPSRESVFAAAKVRAAGLLAPLTREAEQSGPEDESWYWAAPVLLDRGRAPGQIAEWFAQRGLAATWPAGDAQDEEHDRWADHVAEAVRLRDASSLGRPPADLVQVVAEIGLAGPAVAMLRALARIAGGSAVLDEPWARNAAAHAAWGLRGLFNQAEAMAIVRGIDDVPSYWRRVLQYCVHGNLQAVLDEYAHVLREGLGLVERPAPEVARRVADAIRQALGLRTVDFAVDDIRVRQGTVTLSAPSKRPTMRSHFAVRFGQESADRRSGVGPDSADSRSRAENVRTAFNSPFWPFVLATTSVGQEGLDFHTYCHTVVHWNLPSNPVDLEQREGRVHRYKGHAVRKNLALALRSPALNSSVADPWEAMFEAGRSAAGAETNDLVPYWVFTVPNGSTIERHLFALPLSREAGHIDALRRSLAAYRMVFGQPRQDDLVAYLLGQVPPERLTSVLEALRIDLSPPMRAITDGEQGHCEATGHPPHETGQ
jgi:hypothetical protein